MDERSIKGMLDDLLHEAAIETIQGGSVEFVKSVNEFYQKRGFLTEKQEAVLRKIFGRTFQ